MGFGRSMGAAFLILSLSNQPRLQRAKLDDAPSVCALPYRLRDDAERELARQRCQLGMGNHSTDSAAIESQSWLYLPYRNLIPGKEAT